MGKKIVLFIVLSTLTCLCGLVYFNDEIYKIVMEFAASTPILKDIYNWLRTNFYDVWSAIRYGNHGLVFVILFFIIVASLISFKVLKVEKLDESSMPILNVSQKPIITSRNGQPAIVCVEETQVEDE